jgi:C4-dicarboxylate transporter, DctM subunit
VEAHIIGALGILIFIVLVVMGCWIGFAAATVGLIGVFVLKGWEGMAGLAGFLPYAVNASFSFSVIPLFIIMGYFAFYAGLTGNLYDTTRKWVGHLPGGLAIATIFGAAAFGACTGSSTAAAAVFGKVAIPEMKKYNYSEKLASGSVASAGTLASMIPPSIIMVLYGILTEQSIGKLLIAGFIPGIVQAILFSIVVLVWCSLVPSAGKAMNRSSWKMRFIALKGTCGMLILLLIILVGLYTGVFTPTEAGGIGAFAALMLSIVMKKLTWENYKLALVETGKTTSMIFATLLGVMILLRFLTLSGITMAVAQALIALPLPKVGILLVILVIYLIMGMIVSATGMMMLTLPFIFPVIINLGYDPLWFGIVVVTMCEIAFITPPVSMNIYAVKSVAPEIATETIIQGTMPFLLITFVFVGLLIVFPEIALWLPNMMAH